MVSSTATIGRLCFFLVGRFSSAVGSLNLSHNAATIADSAQPRCDSVYEDASVPNNKGKTSAPKTSGETPNEGHATKKRAIRAERAEEGTNGVQHGQSRRIHRL